jgi:F-type H+-transporting ATPase subunit alpha
MAALLTLEKDNTDKVVRYVDEVKRLGLELFAPDINKSDLVFSARVVDNREVVMFGMGAIKGAGDVAAYIPTNVISITDGQIFLETNLFNSGIRPAINVGLSVSRVGGAAQIKATKQVAGTLKLSLAQYRELEAFAQFASDLDEATRRELELGQRMVEVLKQGVNKPLVIEKQIVIIYAGTKGYLNDIAVKDVVRFENELHAFFEQKYSNILESIKTKQKLDDENEAQLKAALEEFKTVFNAK